MNLDTHAVPRLTAMINDALGQEASDVLISVIGLETQVLFSIHGHRLNPGLSPVRARLIVNEIENAISAQSDRVEGQCFDGKFDLVGLDSGSVRVRLARIPTLQGCDIMMKLLKLSGSTTPFNLEDLGYSEKQLNTVKNHRGPIYVKVLSGRTGAFRIE